MILSHIRFLKSITRKHNQIQYRTFLIKSNVIIQGNHRAWNFRLRLVKKLLVLNVLFTFEMFLARQYGSKVLRNDIINLLSKLSK